MTIAGLGYHDAILEGAIDGDWGHKCELEWCCNCAPLLEL